MNMLSSHRIAPSIVSGYSDHVLDQSSLNSSSHRIISERSNISSDRSSMAIERQTILNDRITFVNDRSSFSNERSNFINDRPSLNGDRASFLSERSRIPVDRPSMLNERQNGSMDRSNITSDRSASSQRKNFSNDRPVILNERQVIANDRSLSNGRHNNSDDHHLPDSRDGVLSDRSSDRSSYDRINGRPNISVEHSMDRPGISTERPNASSDRSSISEEHDRKSKSPHNPGIISDRQPVHPTSYSKTTIFRGEMFRGPHDTPSHPDTREYNGRFEGTRITKPQADTSVENGHDESIQSRTVPDSAYSTRHIFHVHPSTTQRNSPKLSENATQIYSNYSMVSTNSVRPIMVPGTTHEKLENKFGVKSLPPHSNAADHAENFDKGSWKSYNFIDKSGEYLSPVPKSVTTADSHDKQNHVTSHARPAISPYSHPNHQDKLPPSYNSITREKVSPGNYPYGDDSESLMHIDKHMSEKSYKYERQAERHYIPSRSPSSMPEQPLDKPELIRKPFMPPERNNSRERTIIPAKRTYYSRNSPERYEYADQPVSKGYQRFSPRSNDSPVPPVSIPFDQKMTTHGQTFPYNKSPIPERSIFHDKLSVKDSNTCSSDMPSVSTSELLRSSDKHALLPDKSHLLPVSVVVTSSPVISEIQPLNGDNSHAERCSPREKPELSNKSSTSYSRPSNPNNSSPLNEISHSLRNSMSNETQTFSKTDTLSINESPVVRTSEVHINGHNTVSDYLSNESAHVEKSLEPAESTDIDSVGQYNELSNGGDERDERMTSPVPPVVILNPEDVDDDDDDADMASFDETTNELENDIDENMEDRSQNSPVSLRDHPVLSSERPSMLSDSPSMVSAISVRPSMVSGDGNADNGLIDASINSTSDKPNVVKRGKRKKYQKYTPADRIAIGKFCFEHGPAAARKAFQSRYPEMSESVTRGFRDKYKLMIGEYAVYVYEQKRRREMHARTESLPRGRPRKYKQVETEDKPLPTTTAPVTVSAPPPAIPTLPEPPKPIENDHPKSENGVTEEQNTKSNEIKEYTREEKLLIGWFCAKHGAEVALKVFTEEHPDLTLEIVVTFHKMYIESEGQITDNEKADVFVVESDNNSLHSPPSSNNHMTSPSESIAHDNSSPDESNETKNSTENRNSSERELDGVSKSDEMVNNLDSVSPVTSPKRPVGPIPVSPRTITPIIHYPKISPDSALRSQPPLEPRDFKHEFSNKMDHNGETLGYPYDRQMYMYGDDALTNGSSSLPRTKRFKYQKYSPEDRYNIGKLCNDIGLGATVKVYREQFPRLNESVVRTFRNKYRELLQKGNGVPVAEAIQRKPSRRSITTVIESEVVSQLRQFKQSNIEINEKLVVAIAENIIATKDQKDIGPVKNTVTTEWASSLLWKHKLVERVVSNPNGVCCERCKTPLVCPKC